MCAFLFQGKFKRSCHVKWFSRWTWLHYNRSNDSVICFLCTTAENKNLISNVHKRDPAFVQNGFRNWKKATTRFIQHESSNSHREATERLNWLSDTIQNEIVQLMARTVQRQITEEASDSKFVSIVADGTTDVSGQEQFSICLQYCTKDLRIENSFLGLYNAPDSSGQTLASVITDVLLWMSIPLCKLQGFAFDGAANMRGCHQGVEKWCLHAPLGIIKYLMNIRL